MLLVNLVCLVDEVAQHWLFLVLCDELGCALGAHLEQTRLGQVSLLSLVFLAVLFNQQLL